MAIKKIKLFKHFNKILKKYEVKYKPETLTTRNAWLF